MQRINSMSQLTFCLTTSYQNSKIQMFCLPLSLCRVAQYISNVQNLKETCSVSRTILKHYLNMGIQCTTCNNFYYFLQTTLELNVEYKCLFKMHQSNYSYYYIGSSSSNIFESGLICIIDSYFKIVNETHP